MGTLLENLGLTTLIAMGLMAVASIGWLVTVAVSVLSRATRPKAGMRRVDLLAIAASIVFALTVGFAMSTATADSKPKSNGDTAKQTSVSRGTCASLRVGMKAREVKSAMGEPDEIRSEEDVRGPAAQTWVYRASRCSVHVLSDRVDFID